MIDILCYFLIVLVLVWVVIGLIDRYLLIGSSQSLSKTRFAVRKRRQVKPKVSLDNETFDETKKSHQLRSLFAADIDADL